ncbi:MAG TPA: hypothetical protein VFS16_05380, partial [Acidimicrobiia bacterium]|nr:hypothetical protein [Acidimicrobiia bacterium]
MAGQIVAVPWWTRVRAALPVGGSLSDPVWRARHTGIVVVLWGHAALIPVFALIRGYSPLHAVAEGAIVPAAALLAGASALGRRTRTAVASIGLLSASAVLVHLSGGVIEMHFHFFVMVALATLYQDWVPFLAAIGYVFVHHGLIGALDATSVFNHPAAQNQPWKWAGVHALFIMALSLVCLVTWRQNERLVDERRVAEEAERDARTAAEEAGARLALLAEATRALTSSLELDVIVRDLARLVIPTVADVCLIDLVEPDGSIRRAAAAAAPGCDSSVLDGMSSVVVPLAGRHGTLGSLSLLTRERPGIEPPPRAFAEEIARRVSIGVEHARLF